MAATKTYKAQTDKKNMEKLRALLKELPPYCADFFRGIENTTSSLTRLNYGYDLRLFFTYLCQEGSPFKGKLPTDISLQDLDSLSSREIEIYLQYLNYYTKNEKDYSNH